MIIYNCLVIIISEMEINQLRSNVVNIINQTRNDPKAAAEYFYNTLAPHFTDEQLKYWNKCIQTFQGIEALEDMKKTLKTAPVAEGLILSESLNRAAQLIAQEKGNLGRTDHQTPQAIYQRISAIGQVKGRIGELISLKAHSGEEIATYFLMDDGLATRKRRRMLLDRAYRYIGVGTSYHRHHQTITVILLAEQVSELEVKQYQSYNQGQSRMMEELPNNSQFYRGTQNDYRFA